MLRPVGPMLMAAGVCESCVDARVTALLALVISGLTVPPLTRLVNTAAPPAGVKVTVKFVEAPEASIPAAQTTFPAEKAPPDEAETKVTFAGTVSVSVTFAAD